MLKIIILFLILSLSPTVVMAGNWQFNIMGITPEDFAERNIVKVIIGVIASAGTHELSHYIYGNIYGKASMKDLNYITFEDYYNQPYHIQQNFHRAGFVGQLLVGSVLTAIPKTRHADFTLGFNTFTTTNTGIYAATGGIYSAKNSDILQLDNGRTEGTVYTVLGGFLSYINLNKY